MTVRGTKEDQDLDSEEEVEIWQRLHQGHRRTRMRRLG